MSTKYKGLKPADGSLGKGYYSSYEAVHCSQFHKTGFLVLNWVGFYAAFPTSKYDFHTFKGKESYLNYDMIFASMQKNFSQTKIMFFNPSAYYQDF